MDNDMTEIAARLAALIDKHGDTQAELARVLEIDESAVSRLLAGRRGLAAEELARVCAHYGVSSDEVLFGATGSRAGAILRADSDADVEHVIARVEEAFADLRYLRALVEP